MADEKKTLPQPPRSHAKPMSSAPRHIQGGDTARERQEVVIDDPELIDEIRQREGEE